MITSFAVVSVIVDMLVAMGEFAPMSMSVRPFMPLMRLVTVGDGAFPPIAAAAPPSMVVFCTMVTSACTTAEHTANARSVADQRFILRPPTVNGYDALLAGGVVAAAPQLGDVARLLAVIAAVLAELAMRSNGTG